MVRQNLELRLYYWVFVLTLSRGQLQRFTRPYSSFSIPQPIHTLKVEDAGAQVHTISIIDRRTKRFGDSVCGLLSSVIPSFIHPSFKRNVEKHLCGPSDIVNVTITILGAIVAFSYRLATVAYQLAVVESFACLFSHGYLPEGL